MKRLLPFIFMAAIPAVTTAPPKPAVVTSAPAHTKVVAPKPVQVPPPDSYSVPETSITGVEQTKRGQLVILSAAPVAKTKGLSQWTYVWVVEPRVNGTLAWPDGSKIVFSSGTDSDPVSYDVTMVANYLFTDPDGKNPVLKTVEATHTVTIEAPAPPPAPEPGPAPGPAPPPPAPTPVVPDGKYKIGQVAYDIAKAHPVAEAQALATAYRTLANSSVGTKAELVNATVPAIQSALGTNLESWRNDLNALADKVNALNVTPVAECKILYAEVATGLEARK